MVEEAPKRENPNVCTNGVVKQTIEQSIEEEEQNQAIGDIQKDELQSAVQEKPALPLQTNKFPICIRLVLWESWGNVFPNERQELIGIDDLTFFFLN